MMSIKEIIRKGRKEWKQDEGKRKNNKEYRIRNKE